MSEEMGIERMAEEQAKLDGYLTVCRVPFKKKRGHGDIDIIGYHPSQNKVLLIECKATGPPDRYPNWNTPRRKKKLKEMACKLLQDWITFTTKSTTNPWGFREEQVKEMRLVIPGYFQNKELLHEIEQELSSELQYNPEIKVIPIHEMIANLIEKVKKDKDIRRKRYPVSALELIRWLTRCRKQIDFNKIAGKTGKKKK